MATKKESKPKEILVAKPTTKKKETEKKVIKYPCNYYYYK